MSAVTSTDPNAPRLHTIFSSLIIPARAPHFPCLPISHPTELAEQGACENHRKRRRVVASRVMHSSKQTGKRAHAHIHMHRVRPSFLPPRVANPEEPLEMPKMPINHATNSFPLSCPRRLFVCLFLDMFVFSASAGKFLHMHTPHCVGGVQMCLLHSAHLQHNNLGSPQCVALAVLPGVV